MDKKAKIKALVEEMLEDSKQNMMKKIDHILNSGAIDADAWEPDNNPMIIPKCIVLALLEHETTQYDARGTNHQRRIKKEVRNIRYFI